MNPRPMAGRGFGPGCMPGTKHLFGEQSSSSAVCLRQLFPQRPIFPQHGPAALIGWGYGTLLLPPPPGEMAVAVTAGDWKERADPRTGGEETQEQFSSIYPVPFPPAANEPPSQAWWERRLQVGKEKGVRSALRNGTLHSNLLAYIPKIIRTQLPQG